MKARHRNAIMLQSGCNQVATYRIESQREDINMKKLVALVLAIVLSAGIALAEGIDLSGMSYDELVALKDRINLAMWQSDEWQMVL